MGHPRRLGRLALAVKQEEESENMIEEQGSHVHGLLCYMCEKIVADLPYLLVQGRTYHKECWDKFASEDKYDVETTLRKAVHQFAATHLEKPVKIVLSPPLWVRFVRAFHHPCHALGLIREIRASPRLYEELKKLDFQGVRVELADHVTMPEAVVVGRTDLALYVQRLSILGRGT